MTTNVYSHIWSLSNNELIRANYINTINVLKGFAQNDVIVHCSYTNLFDIENVKNLYDLNKYKNIKYFYADNHNDIFNYIQKNMITIVYARDFSLPLFLLNSKYMGEIYLESHSINGPPSNIIKYKEKIIYVTISDILKNIWKFPKTIVFPCAIDYDFFSQKPIESINFNYTFNICYCGHVYHYKGIPMLIEASKILKDIGFHIIGGYKEDIDKYKNYPKNVLFYGNKSQNEVRKYLYSSQLLILPYTNKHSQSTTTSPIKLFEYLSTGIPVLSSNIQGIRTWVGENINYYESDNLQDLCDKILIIKNNYNQYNKYEQQKIYAKEFSCYNKVKKMINETF